MQNNNFGDITTKHPLGDLPDEMDCNLCDYWEWDDFGNRVCGFDICQYEKEEENG
jgi:hypothetical protein